MRQKIGRLIEYFVPETYDLKLSIDDEKLTFNGKVIINGNKVGQPTKRLTFHQRALKIKSAKVEYYSKSGPVALSVSRINLHKSFDEVRLHFDQQIYPGKYKVEFEFEGLITPQMEGIYPSYFQINAHKEKLIATQFESHFAREAFPCIDEPEAKAVFNLTLETRQCSTVVSNGDVKSQKKLKNKLVTTFEQTPKMSTYLLAFVFGDMEYLEGKTKSGIRVRTYATRDKIKYTEFALNCAAKILDFYAEYYGIAFPLSKCDFVALPDFASGAMENWGCITFREQALLIDPEDTSLAMRQYVANVVAHELAHQWFGNLVTMKWWNDLWLNESFASWMSYLAVDNLYPDWHVWTQFVYEEQERALLADSLEHTHPIEVKVNHPDEIRTIFDIISYEKGASVISMLNSYVGAENFKKGVNLYLKRHAYGNSVTTDLWQAIEDAAGKEVKEFMHTWVSQSGYPIVKVGYVDQLIKLTQKRFYINPSAKKADTLWPAPVTLEDKSVRLFYRDSIKIEENIWPTKRLINQDRLGFYRVAYSDKFLNQLFAKSFKHYDAIDRLALLTDQVEAAKAGYTSTLIPLKMLEHYSGESELVVWQALTSFIGSIRSTMKDEELRESVKPFIRNFISLQLKRLGLEEKKTDAHLDKLLRPIILGLAAVADEPKVVKYLEENFNKDTLHPDYKAIAYSAMARRGDEVTFDKLLKMHRETINPEEKLNLCSALCSFKQPELIKRALALISSDEVRRQDAFYWIAYSFSNFYGRDITWQWFKDKWEWIQANFSGDLSYFNLPNYVARCYSDKKHLKEYEEFFKARSTPGLERAINQGIETITWQAAWRERDLKIIKKFFS